MPQADVDTREESEVMDPPIATRERIVVLLRQHTQLSAKELALELGVHAVGIRRHLVALEREGLVRFDLEHRPRGRPRAQWRLTDAALQHLPRRYEEVAREAMAFLKGQDGQLLGSFLQWRNDRLAVGYATAVSGSTVTERTQSLALALNEQGFMTQVEEQHDGTVLLCQHHCVVEHVASDLPDLCASETALFERLLGFPVRREETLVSGGRRCVTHIGEVPGDRDGGEIVSGARRDASVRSTQRAFAPPPLRTENPGPAPPAGLPSGGIVSELHSAPQPAPQPARSSA